MSIILPQQQISIDYSYESVPTIRRFALSDKRIRGIMGPFGSGKSSGCIWEIIFRSQAQAKMKDGIKRTRWAIIRNTYPQLKDTTIRTVKEWFPPNHFGIFKEADHEYIITRFDGMEVTLLFRALDKPEHVANLLSLELTGAWVNEAREVPKAILDALDGRIGRFPPRREGGCTWSGIIMDTNPPDDANWWYKYFEEERPPNAECFKQPSGLSPQAENIPNLEPGYYQNLAIGKSRDFINVYIHGQYGYVKEGRPVYDRSWNDDLHVSRVPIAPVQGRELILGFDFGLTPAAVICQHTPRGYFNVLRELTSEGMGIKQFLVNVVTPELVSNFRGFPIIACADPAGSQRSQTDEKTCYDILWEEKIKAIPARTNDLTARIGAVENLLSRLTDGKPTFQLDPSCKMLRAGFNGKYGFAKIQGTERYGETPVKNQYSHPHDGLQYAALHVAEVVRSSNRIRSRPTPPRRAATIAGY